MFKREFDVFIAYHGTYDILGPKIIAEMLYEFLIDKGYKVFYFPRSGRDIYKANIIESMKSKCFLLVVNENIKRKIDESIDQAHHYELSTEIDAFYALTQLGAGVTVSDSKVLVTGNYKGFEGKEAKLHELFANRTHFYYNEQSFNTVREWLNERNIIADDNGKWQNKQTSTEILEVFGRRSSMSQNLNLPQMLASSKNIKSIGISNSEITVKMDIEAIKYALVKGAKIEIIFLDPYGIYTKEREKEESLRENRIRSVTINNLEHALDIRDTLPDELRSNYKLFIYDKQPRMNIIILDEYVVLQYYSNTVPGMSNPCFLIEKKQNSSPLYDFCIASYEELKKTAKEIN